MTEIKEKFINKIIECLSNEIDVDIPYVLSPLIQSIDNNSFDGLFEDLYISEYYTILYECDTTCGYSNGSIAIYLTNSSASHRPNYSYQILFTDNYDGDDWYAPVITLNKINSLCKVEFEGYEEGYLTFKERFYNLQTEAKDKQERIEKEARITYLRDTITQMQVELAEMV